MSFNAVHPISLGSAPSLAHWCGDNQGPWEEETGSHLPSGLCSLTKIRYAQNRHRAAFLGLMWLTPVPVRLPCGRLFLVLSWGCFPASPERPPPCWVTSACTLSILLSFSVSLLLPPSLSLHTPLLLSPSSPVWVPSTCCSWPSLQHPSPHLASACFPPGPGVAPPHLPLTVQLLPGQLPLSLPTLTSSQAPRSISQAHHTCGHWLIWTLGARYLQVLTHFIFPNNSRSVTRLYPFNS